MFGVLLNVRDFPALLLAYFINGMGYFNIDSDCLSHGTHYIYTPNDMLLSLALLLGLNIVMYLTAIGVFKKAKVVQGNNVQAQTVW